MFWDRGSAGRYGVRPVACGLGAMLEKIAASLVLWLGSPALWLLQTCLHYHPCSSICNACCVLCCALCCTLCLIMISSIQLVSGVMLRDADEGVMVKCDGAGAAFQKMAVVLTDGWLTCE